MPNKHIPKADKKFSKEEIKDRKAWKFLEQTYNREELGPCNKEYKRWKKCLVLVESRFEYCRREEIEFRRCEALNLVNLEFFLKHGLNPTNYIRTCQDLIMYYDRALDSHNYNEGYPWNEDNE